MWSTATPVHHLGLSRLEMAQWASHTFWALM
jgi:hypothetical protein